MAKRKAEMQDTGQCLLCEQTIDRAEVTDLKDVMAVTGQSWYQAVLYISYRALASG